MDWTLQGHGGTLAARTSPNPDEVLADVTAFIDVALGPAAILIQPQSESS